MRSTLFQLLLYLFWITTFTWKPNDNRRFTKLMELWKHCLVAEHDRWTATSASGPSRMQVLLPGTAFQSTFVASPHLKPSEDIWKRFYSLKLLTLPRTFNIVMPAGHLCKWTQYRRWYWWWWCPVRLRCLKNSTACNRHLNPVHTGDKVDRIGNKVDRDSLSNSRCFRFVAKTGNKVERILEQSTLLPICCRFRQQSTFNKVDRVEFNFVASVYRA